MPFARLALAALLAGTLAHAQAPTPAAAAPAKALSAGEVLDRQLARLEREFVPAAEALDEAHYGFAPTAGEFKGVKTFARQVRHVASANFQFAAGILGEKAPVDLGGDDGPEALKTKAEIVTYLKASFAYAHKAFASLKAEALAEPIPSPWGSGTTTRLALAVHTVDHGYDHYGQLVVYLRLNGIIPPASRQ
ncbi:DinB family protein [Geothrix sp. PMB-07]|uniref:DinB family protein n=1 Tax=Geothrix sp. PMB-07 TaxID=3068640 RepID=UPI0027425E4A|nr:DinB family protein [Geothrix sp. PMB-07]WLT32716.1 DinB family protein [Geothrix sp. PMB-07]